MLKKQVRRRGAACLRAVGLVGFAGASLGFTALTTAGFFGGGVTDALPPVPFPAENPFSEQKRILGKILFWDEQLSSDNTVACATCHQAEFGGSDSRRARHPGVDGVLNTPDDVFGSPGVIRQNANDEYQRDPVFGFAARATSRGSQGVINAAYTPIAFWDGRGSSTFTDPQTGQVAIATGGALESQLVGPPLNDTEMAHANRDWNQIAAKLRTAGPLALATSLPPDVQSAIQSNPSYPSLFAQAFGDSAITAKRIAFAIATYERTLIADQTDWDAFQAGNTAALTAQEQQGMQLMQVRNCTQCHTPPLFTNASLAAPTVPLGAMFRNIGLRPPGDDSGRFAITGIPGDDRRFKVPGLRNAGLKRTFTHSGQFTTLQQIVGFYPAGNAQFPQNRDPLIPIPLNPQEQAAIVAFIQGGLTDPRVAAGTFPFDHPTLFSSRPNVNLTPIGVGAPGVNGLEPQWIARTPPNVGNTGFKVGVQGARAGATATLRVSTSAPVNDIVAPDQLVGPFVLDATGTIAQGYATAKWPIPNNPSLNGQTVYMQWFIDDPSAVDGVARTRPLMVDIFCGTTGCPPTICYANCDESSTAPVLNAGDFTCFLNKFRAAQSLPAAQQVTDYANCDGSATPPVLNAGDFTCFLTKFRAGCP